MQNLYDYKQAHKHSLNHRKEVEASQNCGCFYCLSIFLPSQIKEWVDEDEEDMGTTALCPKCGIDSVLGDKSGYPIYKDFLQTMNKIWFKYVFVSI